MDNKTTIKVPKKYHHMLDSLTKMQYTRSTVEYTAYSKDGYYFYATECHIAYGNTQAEILEDIRTLTKCDCEDCIEVWEKKKDRL